MSIDENGSATAALLANNAAYTAGFALGEMAAPPSKQIAIVTCMDARLDIEAILGIEPGEAHIIRNAGGVISDDTLRSLCLSQRALGTREILIMQHTKCGVLGLDDSALRAELRSEVGVEPDWPFHGFDDLEASVRRSIATLRDSPFVPHTDQIVGAIYDVTTGTVTPID